MFAWLSKHIFIHVNPPDITDKRTTIMLNKDRETTMLKVDRKTIMILNRGHNAR